MTVLIIHVPVLVFANQHTFNVKTSMDGAGSVKPLKIIQETATCQTNCTNDCITSCNGWVHYWINTMVCSTVQTYFTHSEGHIKEKSRPHAGHRVCTEFSFNKRLSITQQWHLCSSCSSNVICWTAQSPVFKENSVISWVNTIIRLWCLMFKSLTIHRRLSW